MRQKCSWFSWPTILLVAIFVVGCGSDDEIPTGAVKGTITINGQPEEGVNVEFVPKAAIRPSSGVTDAQGNYETQITNSQSGVAVGDCVVNFYLYRGGDVNLLPPEFHETSADNPELNLSIPAEGIEFNYDIKFEDKGSPSN